MRTLIITAATAFVLLIGFGAYWWMQGGEHSTAGHRGRTGLGEPAAMPLGPDVHTGGAAGPTSNPIISKFNPRDGRKVLQMSARMSRTQPDKRLYVEEPQVDFYMSDGQIVRVCGKWGVITTREGLKTSSQLGGGASQSPNSGELYDVTVFLLKHMRDREPLKISINNASFDSETFRIWTDAYTDPTTKRQTPGDQVRVTMTSPEYEFSGRGLDIRWDEADERLASLTVAHGERLVVKHPKSTLLKHVPTTQPGEASADRLIEEIALASADPAAAGVTETPARARGRRRRPATAPVSRPMEQRNEEPPLYRATFAKSVVVTQGLSLHITSEQLQMEFLMQPEKEEPTTSPATAPAAEAARATEVAPDVAPAETTRRRAKRAATQPTTQAGDEPVVVTWTGPLTIRPIRNELMEDLEPGDSIVTFTGRPVVAEREGSTLHTPLMKYFTADGRMLLESAGGQQVVLTDPRQATITTGSMEYDEEERVATLLGKSSATIPLEPGSQPMSAEWTEKCTLHFAGADMSQLAIERAELEGQVSVTHPHLEIGAKKLNMDFDPSESTTRPAKEAATQSTSRPAGINMKLRKLDATGAVHAKVADNPAKPQTIDCSRSLTLIMGTSPDGKSYPKSIVAVGDVHAVDPEQDLQAGYLSATMRPTTRPTTAPTTRESQFAQAELESLVAHDNVRVQTGKSTTATGEQLLINVKEGKQHLTLLGTPEHLASLVDKRKDNENTLSSTVIEFDRVIDDASQRKEDPLDGHLTVPRPGTLTSSQRDNPQQPPRPVVVSWTGSLSAPGAQKPIECVGGVVVKSTDADGTANEATAGRAKLVLGDAPTTQPSADAGAGAGAGAGAAPTTQPKKDELGLGGKEVREVFLYEKAVVVSTLLKGDGVSILKRTQVEGETIEFHASRDAAGALRRSMVIPVPGRMLVEDHRPPSTQPAGGADTNESLANARGTTAMEWKKSLSYDESTGQAIMQGAHIVHREEGSDTNTYDLQGASFTATLEVSPAQPSAKPGDMASRIQVKRFQGAGGIEFKAKGVWILAETMDYDPARHLLTARGTERQPGQRLNDQRVVQETFDELQFDVQGNLFVLKNVSHKGR